MKAERRHELQTNALAKFLSELPLYFQFHLGKILLVVLAVVAVGLLVRHRMTAARDRPMQTINRLTEARLATQQLQQMDLVIPDLRQRAEQRRQLASQAEGLLDEILQTTADPGDSAIRAEALVALGDLFWIQANLPELPGATTQPLLAMPRPADEYLKRAEDAFQRVLREYGDRQIAAVTARYGLAAIAENRGDWDTARAQYDAILNQEDLPRTMRDLALNRMEYLRRYQEPLYTGTVEAPPGLLPELPEPIADPGPATLPADDPATLPADEPLLRPALELPALAPDPALRPDAPAPPPGDSP